MRVLVCGGRDYDDRGVMRRALASYDPRESMLIHGGAPGADMLAASVATELGWVRIRAFLADWDTYGRAAGPIRNLDMLDQGDPEVVLAFPGGRGTADMVSRAEKAGIIVIRPVPLVAL